MPNHILPRLGTSRRLQTVLDVALGDGIAVGLAAIPMVDGVPLPAPHGVLLPLWANELTGPPFGDEIHADVEWVYQVTLAATRGDQIEAMRDRVIGAVLGRVDGAYVNDLDTAGVKIIRRDLTEDNGIGDPIGSVIPSDFRFTLAATPADTTG